MKEPDSVSPQVPASPVHWMRPIASGLASANLSANLREKFVWLDQNAEIRWWNDPSMSQAEVAAQ
jgi:hypothetical protein